MHNVNTQNGDWDFYLGNCPNYLYYVLYYLSPNQVAYDEVILGQGNITLSAEYVEIKNSTAVPLGTTLTIGN